MALDTLTTMVNNVPDWAKYDNAGDGYITGLILVHAGEGAESTASRTDLWSVKWTLPNDQDFVVGGGKKVHAFLTVPQDAAMGLCAHEIGHLVFGWPDFQEYFLIEDREKIDWDQALPGNGLMVLHVDDSILDNDDENHPKVALMEADGLINLKIRGGPSNEGDPFPGSANNRTFNAGSNPNSNTYTAYPTWVAITNIDPALSWINTDISVVVPNWTSSVLAAGPSLSRGCNIAAVSRGPLNVEARWITPLGALMMASWNGSQWQFIEMTTSGAAVPGGAIASVSMDNSHMIENRSDESDADDDGNLLGSP
ncbi:e566d75c-e96b-4543-934e-c285f66a098d [Thermothielavioides terrestris]|uniref:E566d75c-e96b-4543-934e-c285f66a098d n=1 Tax=Thermothielavioides terrestris TaxID=2587410 RepID=A0A3S4C6I6_9PEZI|nr:e566d75c-e96b-4543-934e-c285f66a098d [Thermothielavioides terrestris]